MESEDWKQINGFANYEISSLGRVRSKPRPKTKGGICRYDLGTNGRYKVDLYDDVGKQKTKMIHRLVAIHFLPNLYGLSQVDHVNGNPHDNRVTNLRWCTNQQNQYNTGLRKDNKTGYKGVCFDNSKGRWLVQVQNPYGPVIKKRFKTKTEAIEFRRQMVQIYYDPKFYREL